MTVLHSDFSYNTTPSRRRMTRDEALAALRQRSMPLPGMAPRGAAVAGRPLPGQMTVGTQRSHLRSVSVAGTCMPALSVADSADADTVERPKPRLSDREIEVLRTWLDLDSKSEVAKALYISLGTVNTHLARIRVKYTDVGRPASTKAALVARAIQDGLVSLDDL
ncbi:helix-turn-helix transcriptional regulator [Jongsikchunia kroppenstedtii]|uniref:helix-turn-helix transcriptional regulator n=1 Tax=Jongsikchunia kroppenstedtii TaxID=1121721 RepID=UPI000360442A|nr:helix-turn-helix transcriptional regulator [Jongsikchunia kroppenstedtii]